MIPRFPPTLPWVTKSDAEPGGVGHVCTRKGAYAKTTVFVYEHLTAPSPSQPACLRFNILVQQNNVRETRSDMSKANRSQVTWVQPDIFGLFSGSVGSCALLVKSS
jgi:hypothetical protein